ncbi:hypothetical protein [Hymenobacter guriensis]|uniref:T9SS type A sorting domain-containing protein n=1 Tax=Hymenobacter guriensis TaxID=2793065 RepID=A0ABS0L5Z4_9BACT|nr:hypothetical protein [Hymenobacter guriensis]MBG8555545.1 hypothetical protein [Hymenobacter guriensis]
MQNVTLLSLASLLTLPALAQTPITLTQATFPASAATVERYQDAALPTGAAVTPTGANQTWDYRTLVAEGAPYTFAREPAPVTGGIAGAQWTQPRQAVFGNLAYNYTVYGALASNGWLALGRTMERQEAAITAITGGPNDKVVVDAQTLRYGPEGVANLPLPLTAGDMSRRSFRVATEGTLTVQALLLNNAPIRLVQRYTYVDSVAGWGTLQIPVAGSPAGSDALPVLQIRSRTVRQDSVYLFGQPAPAILLSSFGMQQGGKTPFYFDQFWRNNSAQPVLDLYYTSREYGTPVAADYSTESNVVTARRASVLAVGSQAWPNPFGPGQALRLTLPGAKPGQPLQLTVQDALGRTVLRQALPLLNGAASLPAEATAALRPGLYTLTARQGTEQTTLRLVRR